MSITEVTNAVEVINITPALAREFLTHNTNNRALNERTVSKYQDDMLGGRWSYAADPIRFAFTGALLDGQHRLTAIALIKDDNFSVPLLVVRGLAPESQYAMDQGFKRTAGQQLSLMGIKDANRIASAVSALIRWETGNLLTGYHPTTARIEEWVSEHGERVDFLISIMNAIVRLRGRGANVTALGAFALRAWEISPELVREFITSTADGGHPNGDPRKLLDDFFVSAKRSRVRNTLYRDHLSVISHAWNLWRGGETRTRLAPKAQIPEPR